MCLEKNDGKNLGKLLFYNKKLSKIQELLLFHEVLVGFLVVLLVDVLWQKPLFQCFVVFQIFSVVHLKIFERIRYDPSPKHRSNEHRSVK